MSSEGYTVHLSALRIFEMDGMLFSLSYIDWTDGFNTQHPDNIGILRLIHHLALLCILIEV